MFRKYYKSVNDEIKTNRELIDKIFDEYDKSQNRISKSKVYSFGMKYGTAFAAVLVICVAIAVYPKVLKPNVEPITIEQTNQIDVSKTSPMPKGRISEPSPHESKIYEFDITRLQPITDNDIQLVTNTLEERLGKTDKATGNMYVFEIAGKLETEESSFYLGRWKWLLDDHTSLICEFVLSDDLNELYECTIYDNIVSWTTTKNIFE